MAITKPTFYIGVVFISSLLFVGLLIVGEDLNANLTLDNQSIEYINDYNGYLSNSNLNTINDTNTLNTKEDFLLSGDEDEGEPLFTDNIATWNIYKSTIEPTFNFFKLVYNLPELIVSTTGIPLGFMKPYFSGLIHIIWISLIIVTLRLARGS